MPPSTNKERLLAEGLELLYDRGYEETGVQQITSSCGIPKGSFYYYFKSKEAFALEVIDRYLTSMRRELERQLVEGQGTQLARLRRLFETWIDRFEQGGFERGCLAGSLCQEMAAKNPNFRRAVSGVFAVLQRYFEDCLRAAQEANEIQSTEDPRELAEFVLNSWQGALLRMKASRSRCPFEQFQKQLFGKVLC